ncbi:MAG: sulfotransferase [Pseudomonas sp.]
MHATSARLLQRASALIAQGAARREEAIDTLHQLLAGCPSHAPSWYNLGWLLHRQGQFDAALAAYARALVQGIEAPQEVHLNRAAILSEHLRRPAEARTELECALALTPGYLPAWLNLGNLHEEHGEREAAITCYRRMQELPAHDTAGRALQLTALGRLMQIQPPASPDDPALARLRQAAHAAQVPDETRANLLFSLGWAQDRLGMPDAAFAAFADAKALAHRGMPAYQPRQTEARVEALIQAFPEPVLSRPAPANTSLPVFICGMFRSGSTLLEQALAAHPQVAAGGELDILPRMLAGPLAPFPDSVAGLDGDALERLATHYRQELAKRVPLPPQARLFTDKRPDNFLLIGLIKRLFPEARIVHTRRNPMDNGLAVLMQHLNPRAFPYAGRLEHIGHYYAQHERLMRHWQALYPESIHCFDYDTYVARPRETLAELLRFLELDWDERCLAAHALKNTVKTASYWQVRRPLYTDASGRWRRYAQHLGPLREALHRSGVAVPD